jgi:apolipoprotein N-acyltransferase
LAFPSIITACEYLISLAFGTFGATGYTQLQNLPVLQLATLTGLWGIGFTVMLFPSMIAAMILSPAKARRRLVIAFAVVFGSTLSYGLLRLLITPHAPHEIVAGLVVSDLPKNVLPQKDQDAMRLLRDYADQVKLLSRRGARLVVLPEMTALVLDSISGQVDDLFRQTARDMKVQILLGVLHVTANGTFNEARLYSEAVASNVVYRKHHLVPVVEGRTTPGTDIAIVRESTGTMGLEICRDMDYPDPSRRYGKAHAGLVLAPAWNFDIDRFWHGHMAIMRGVENGFTVVRAAKQGLLTVSDSRGRVLSEKRTTPKEPFTTMVATVPVRHETTLYQSWGDWFARLNVALVAGLFISIVTMRPKELRPFPQFGAKSSAVRTGPIPETTARPSQSVDQIP